MLDFPREGDIDPGETQEWLEALQSVLSYEGPERVQYLMECLALKARETGVALPFNANTPYVNTIPVTEQPWSWPYSWSGSISPGAAQASSRTHRVPSRTLQP